MVEESEKNKITEDNGDKKQEDPFANDDNIFDAILDFLLSKKIPTIVKIIFIPVLIVSSVSFYAIYSDAFSCQSFIIIFVIFFLAVIVLRRFKDRKKDVERRTCD